MRQDVLLHGLCNPGRQAARAAAASERDSHTQDVVVRLMVALSTKVDRLHDRMSLAGVPGIARQELQRAAFIRRRSMQEKERAAAAVAMAAAAAAEAAAAKQVGATTFRKLSTTLRTLSIGGALGLGGSAGADKP